MDHLLARFSRQRDLPATSSCIPDRELEHRQRREGESAAEQLARLLNDPGGRKARRGVPLIGNGEAADERGDPHREVVRRLSHSEKRKLAARIEADEKYLARLSEAGHRRRARMAGNGIEPVDRRAIYRRDDGQCHVCGEDVSYASFHLDHLVPIALGGPHCETNVAVSCARCNLTRKHSPLQHSRYLHERPKPIGSDASGAG